MHLTSTMMEALRGRRRLEKNDTSQDAEIMKMHPTQIVRECVAWELGYSDWANLIAEWMVAAGAKAEDF